jgi:hypothetical protein
LALELFLQKHPGIGACTCFMPSGPQVCPGIPVFQYNRPSPSPSAGAEMPICELLVTEWTREVLTPARPSNVPAENGLKPRRQNARLDGLTHRYPPAFCHHHRQTSDSKSKVTNAPRSMAIHDCSCIREQPRRAAMHRRRDRRSTCQIWTPNGKNRPVFHAQIT